MQSRLELFDKFDPNLRTSVERFLLRKRCRRPSDHTVEVINQAWEKIFNGFGKVRDPDRLGGWMWTVAKNVACDHLRRCINEEDFASQEKKPSDESGEGKIPFDPPELVSCIKLVFENLLTEEILHIAAEISSDFPKLLCFKLIEDLDWRTIAERTDQTVANASSRYNRMWWKLLTRVLTNEALKERLLKKRKKNTDDST